MVLRTPFTKTYGLTVPVCLAPMAGASGGRLAAAVARGGGLGVIAAGSGKNLDRLDEEVRIFKDEAPLGAKLVLGVISWLAFGGGGYGITESTLSPAVNANGRASGEPNGVRSAAAGASDEVSLSGPSRGAKGIGVEEAREVCSLEVLETLLQRYGPSAIWLFAPATPCKEVYTVCHQMGVNVIAQVGTVAQARTAAEMGASLVVAQGREAGGHGLRPDVGRGTLPLAAAVVVELASTGKPVLAAGGVVNGRGLLAALALGCDGVVMGTRYCATHEALGEDDHKAKIVSTSGDDTVRTRVYDMAAAARPSNPIRWPEPYDSSGVAMNAFTARWNSRPEAFEEKLSVRDPQTGYSEPTAQLTEAERYRDLSLARVFMGEGAGLIYSVESAEKLTREVAREAEEQLDKLYALRQPGLDGEGPRRTRGDSAPMILDKGGSSLGSLDDGDDLIRERRANTASSLPNPARIPGTRQVISSGSAYEAIAGYSRAVRVGRHVQVAGTTATNPDGSGVLCKGDVVGQTQYVFHIIALALREASCSLENVVRTRMFVTDIANAEKVMAEHCKVFDKIRPAATLVVTPGDDDDDTVDGLRTQGRESVYAQVKLDDIRAVTKLRLDVSALVHPELLVEIEADALEP